MTVLHFKLNLLAAFVNDNFDILKARLHDQKNWNGPDKKTNGSDKILRVNST